MLRKSPPPGVLPCIQHQALLSIWPDYPTEIFGCSANEASTQRLFIMPNVCHSLSGTTQSRLTPLRSRRSSHRPRPRPRRRRTQGRRTAAPRCHRGSTASRRRRQGWPPWQPRSRLQALLLRRCTLCPAREQTQPNGFPSPKMHTPCTCAPNPSKIRVAARCRCSHHGITTAVVVANASMCARRSRYMGMCRGTGWGDPNVGVEPPGNESARQPTNRIAHVVKAHLSNRAMLGLRRRFNGGFMRAPDESRRLAVCLRTCNRNRALPAAKSSQRKRRLLHCRTALTDPVPC